MIYLEREEVRDMTRLKKWAFVTPYGDYAEPLHARTYLVGEVYGHRNPKHYDGKKIYTSALKWFDGQRCQTLNTLYQLCDLDPKFMAWMAAHGHRLEDYIRWVAARRSTDSTMVVTLAVSEPHPSASRPGEPGQGNDARA